MTDPAPEAWMETITARERVRAVVELLDERASIEYIAERADTSLSTADRELGQLQSEGPVDFVEVDDKVQVQADPERLLADEIQRLIEDHSREELEAELQAMLDEEDTLQDEFDASSSADLRRWLAREEASAEEVREIRNAVSTWRALEADIRLYRHMLEQCE